MEKFFQALAALLPTGFAWPRDPGATLMRVIRALAGTFSEHHDFTTEAVRQWQPATTVNRLAEWEQATGLPDACFTPPLELLLPGRYPVEPVRIASTTRNTPATYIDDAGVVRTAAANVARFEGGQLVVDAEAVNLFVNSEVLLGSTGTSATANATTSPDGALTADLILETAVNSEHYANDRNIAVTAGVPTTFMAHVKLYPGSTRLFYMRTATAGTGQLFFDPATGLTSGLGGVFSNARAIALADGWWRLVATVTPTATGNLVVRFQLRNAGLSSYLGVVTQGMYFWGGDFKVGGESSYIPTGAAAATRAADQIYLFPTEAATRDLRRQLLLSRLRGPVLAYDNSSPSCTGAIVAICAGLGYVATMAYNTPFRCGVNRVGERLGALDGKLYVTVTLESKAFRVGSSRVGQRLLEGQLNGGELACYLQQVIPARYQLNMIFI